MRTIQLLSGRLLLTVLMTALVTPVAYGQRLKGLPVPKPVLLVVQPCGGQVGTTVDVTLTGVSLDDPEKLLFSEPAIQAERIADPKPPAPKKNAKQRPKPRPRGRRGPQVTIRYRITIPPGTALGIHDVRVVNRLGVSNPRAFVVGDLPEVRDKEPNNDVRQAQRVPLDCTINGVISASTDVDYFVFAGHKGQRVVMSCLASSIDSRLGAGLELYDVDNHWLGENRHYNGGDALLDCTLPHDGDYFLRVFQFAYNQGSPQHFYRLTISTAPWIDSIFPSVVEPGTTAKLTVYGRNLPGGKLDPSAVVDGRVLERLTVTVPVPADAHHLSRLSYTGRIRPVQSALSGFEYRVHNATGASNPYLLVFTTAPVVLDNGDNDTAETAQHVRVPCEIAGWIEKLHDQDWYAFEARRGTVYRIEVYGDRLGAQADMYFVVRDATGRRSFGELDDTIDSLSQNKLYTRDTDPPSFRFRAPTDGWYRLLVSSRDADALADVRQIYRVRVTPELPDFQLVAMGPSNSSGEVCTLRAGGDQYYDVFAWRQDGYNGPIQLTAEDLPAGVTCRPQILGPGMKHTALVLHAVADTAAWTGGIRICGTATIHGHSITREARAASITWPVPPQVSVPLVSRLDRQLLLAVRDRAPFRLEATLTKPVLTQGQQTKVTVTLTCLSPEFSGPVQVLPVRQAPNQAIMPGNLVVNQNNNQPLMLTKDKPSGTMTITARPNAQPGTFNIVLQGQAALAPKKGQRPVRGRNFILTLPAPPVTLAILPRQVARLDLSSRSIAIKPGKTIDLRVRIARLNGYDGPLQVQVVLPADQKDISIKPTTIAAGRNDARLSVHALASARPGFHTTLPVRATARIDGQAITQEVKLNLKISR